MMRLLHSLGISFAVIMLLAAMARATDIEPPGDVRTELTAEALMEGAGLPDQMIHNAWFIPVGEAGPALHSFSGTLVIPETEMLGFDGYDVPDNWYPEGRDGNDFPAIEVGFVSHGDYLIPIDAGILVGNGEQSQWNLIVSPGRIWSEPTDNGLSRASFPFVLAWRAWTEAHNGLATFVFDDDTVSAVQFQIVQETAVMNEFQAFGRLDAAYLPQAFDNEKTVIAAFENDLATRLPVRPFADLEDGLSHRGLMTFAAPQPNAPASAAGLILDGVMYLRPCETKYGDFPYCEDMRHSVYSVSKSLGGMIGMLYLAEKYGDHVFDLKIKDYVDIIAGHQGWDEVTFADALNMASGVGEMLPDPDGRTGRAEDVESERWWTFSNADSAADKLQAAFSGPRYDWGPGVAFRYRDMDSFALAAAMDGFIKTMEGPDANLWDMITQEVLLPIGITALPMSHTHEADGSRGIPIMAVGAYPNVQDIAKIAALLDNNGRYGDLQLLSKPWLDQALYRTDSRGLKVTGGERTSYYMSLWYVSVWVPNCEIDVPTMSGLGGNRIFLLPNGVTVFRFTDVATGMDGRFVEAANEIRPLCPD